MTRALLPLLLLAACGPKKVEESAPADSRRLPKVEELDTRGLTVVPVDLNEDDTTDVFNYYEPGPPQVLVRKGFDFNMDGRVDVVSVYGAGGKLSKELMDGDFDGRFDWVDHYTRGERTRSDVDTNYDGVYDAFTYYEGGKVRKKERDTTGDGNIDFWEMYDADGNVVEADVSGSVLDASMPAVEDLTAVPDAMQGEEAGAEDE